MIESLIKFVITVTICAIVSVIFVSSFDAYYHDLEARRRAKWEARRSREQHPSRGARYE